MVLRLSLFKIVKTETFVAVEESVQQTHFDLISHAGAAGQERAYAMVVMRTPI